MSGKSLTEQQVIFFARLTQASTALVGIHPASDGFATKLPEDDEALILLIDFLRELQQMKPGKMSTLRAAVGIPQKDEDLISEVTQPFSGDIDVAVSVLEQFLNEKPVTARELMQIGRPIRGIANALMAKILEQ
jgi:hypothetical protein